MLKLIFKLNAENNSLGKLISSLSNVLSSFISLKNKINKNTILEINIINFISILNKSKKYKNKYYFRHSKYPGSSKYISYINLLNNKPNKLVKIILKGMLPKNLLSKKILNDKNIKISI
jgi:large subunit ribosomal protein L13